MTFTSSAPEERATLVAMIVIGPALPYWPDILLVLSEAAPAVTCSGSVCLYVAVPGHDFFS